MDAFSVARSETLAELDARVSAVLAGSTITADNFAEVEAVARETVGDGRDVLDELLKASLRDAETVRALAGCYDEKEFWMRLFLCDRGNYSLRLHVWLPSDDGPRQEVAHDHRRYLISTILNNCYRSVEYERVGARIEERRAWVAHAGLTYAIAPELVHAIGNPTARHTASLIVRGAAVKDNLGFFDSDSGGLVEHVGQRPVGALGRSQDHESMGREEYLEWRLRRLAADAGVAVPA